MAARASAAAGWSTSSSRVLSDWTIRGPSGTAQSFSDGWPVVVGTVPAREVRATEASPRGPTSARREQRSCVQSYLRAPRTHACRVDHTGSPGRARPRTACRGPHGSRVGSADRPARSHEKAPPCPHHTLRPPSLTAAGPHLGSGRSRSVGRSCQSATNRHRQTSGGRRRDQHRDQAIAVGPIQSAQLVTGVEARGGRARPRAARDRARRPAGSRPGGDGLGPRRGEPPAGGSRSGGRRRVGAA